MSADTRTVDKLNGYFKTVYLGKNDVTGVIPENTKVQKMIPFSKKNKIGGDLRFPVLFQLEHGFTFGGPDDDVLALNDSIPAQSKEAIVKAYQLVLKAKLSFKAAASSLTDVQAFTNQTKHIVENMITSFRRRQEILLLYGKDGLGQSAGNGTLSAGTGPGGTDQTVITLSAASFAPLIWSGMEGMKVDVYDSTGTILTNGSAVVVAEVDIDAKTLTVNADLVDDADTDLDAGSTIYFSGTSAGTKEMPGIKKILTASTTAETYFGIDPSLYSLWRGTEYAAGSNNLSFTIIQKAVARAVNKGLDKNAVVLCSTLHWADLMGDEASLRRYDSSYSKNKTEKGSMEISFYSQNGELKIVPHGMVKGGDAFIICPELFERVGTVDLTFTIPGSPDEKIFVWNGAETAFIIALYSDQVMFCKKPAAQVYISGLTYTA